MLGIRQTLATMAGVLLLAGTAQAADVFTITSPAFKDGQLLAKKNAGSAAGNPNCVGENVSPPLAWSNVPAGTTSFALVMTDPEGRGIGVDHWIAYGIPASVTSFAEGETSKPSDKYVGGIGTAKQSIYMGPCTPPNQSPHHYTFILIATDLDPKALPAGLTKLELFDKLNGHVKGSTGIIGLFKNPI
ncbi:MAG: YbhB/YbcL family Raf kinase inhibitor-like protein [Hyphomicrobiales bacterium]|nr:YbhB/YbcL family Raf kinase inhibitor-like protein [Alphaproteobacteria bacterium]